MDSKTPNDIPHFISLTSESLFLLCVVLCCLLVGLPGCAHSDNGYDETCYPVSSRVKKSFLFHHDKCSPHPYRSLEGYQTHLDKLVVKHAARKCANQSLKTLACNCKDKPSKAFRDGYREAYVDIALGESGEVPPVPPEEYWAAHYRTAAGYQEIQEWFTGYKLGAEHAWADGRYEFNQIATPYSLAGWDQPQSDYGPGIADYFQSMPQPEANSEYAPPATMRGPQLAPRSPDTMLPPSHNAAFRNRYRRFPKRSNHRRHRNYPGSKFASSHRSWHRNRHYNRSLLHRLRITIILKSDSLHRRLISMMIRRRIRIHYSRILIHHYPTIKCPGIKTNTGSSITQELPRVCLTCSLMMTGFKPARIESNTEYFHKRDQV